MFGFRNSKLILICCARFQTKFPNIGDQKCSSINSWIKLKNTKFQYQKVHFIILFLINKQISNRWLVNDFRLNDTKYTYMNFWEDFNYEAKL